MSGPRLPFNHLQMRWHEAALERHQADLAGLQATRAELQQRLGGGSSGSPGSAAPAAQQQAQHPQQAQQQQPLGDLLGLGGGHPLAQAQAPELEPVWGGSGEAHPPVMGRAVMELQVRQVKECGFWLLFAPRLPRGHTTACLS